MATCGSPAAVVNANAASMRIRASAGWTSGPGERSVALMLYLLPS